MRFRVDVRAEPGILMWETVLSPARGVVYGLLACQAPDLGQQIHDRGWGPARLRPFSCSGPVFPKAPRAPGRFAIGGRGSVAFASPVLEVAGALVKGLVNLDHLRWGSSHWQVDGVAVEVPPDFSSGTAELVTRTPVVVKGPAPSEDGRYPRRPSGTDAAEGSPPDRGEVALTPGSGRFLLPQDHGYEDLLVANARSKALTLGLPEDVDLSVVESGPRRLFRIDGSARIGATLRVRAEADPATLTALWEWGLGQGNSAGFGWIR